MKPTINNKIFFYNR